MCCSRVCRARRNAGRPAVSVLTPTRRPGSDRANDSVAARNAACGPPQPIGTPKRCALPTAMSNPSDAGVVRRVLARGSVTHTAMAPRACAAFTTRVTSESGATMPLDEGRETTTQNASTVARAASGSTSTDTPTGAQRARKTLRCWGCVSSWTATTRLSFFAVRRAMVTASAIAVDSSRSDAFAMSRPVNSVTTVWKFNRPSNRPWLISG